MSSPQAPATSFVTDRCFVNMAAELAPPPVVSPDPSLVDAAAFDARVSAYSTNVLPPDYSFDPTLSLDENYIVLVLLYARLSMSKRGNMACVVVDPSATPEGIADEPAEPPAKRARLSPSAADSSSFPNYPGRILAHSNNFPQPVSVSADAALGKVAQPLKKGRNPSSKKETQSPFQSKASNAPELHAEARCICLAAASGIPLAGSTAYVSFPPCQACLPLLVASGVKRLVYRQTLSAQASIELCRRAGVECVEFTDKALDERLKAQVSEWWKRKGEGKEETRARLERWWAEQERVVMGEAAVETVRPEEESAALASSGAASEQ
ncbi:hypothetical protein JCM8097_007385 [Rhodosporidiobolus ruineniae]